MTVSLDATQSLAEIEHALFKRFMLPSTSITGGVDEAIFAGIERGPM